MKDLLADLERWRAAGKKVALARVVDVEGSGPRGPGAAMAVSEDSEVAGSVSGGCVEGAVVTEALDILTTGERRIVTFGYSDDEAFAVGPDLWGHRSPLHRAHGLVTRVSLYDELREALRDDRPVALATIIDGPGVGNKLLVGPDREPVGTPGQRGLGPGGEPGRPRPARGRSHRPAPLRRPGRGPARRWSMSSSRPSPPPPAC